MPEPGAVKREVVCLLYVRNAGQELEAYLDSVATFADAVVALDDGSTDATADILRRHPLVGVQLASPRVASDSAGATSADWNRLLEAAATLDPRWILSLDTAEHITREDGGALRELVRGNSMRGVAYGFRMHRAGGEGESREDDGAWDFRLFRHRRGQRFPRNPPPYARVPTDIPREHWLKTRLAVHLRGAAPASPTSSSAPVVLSDPDAAATPLAHPELLRSFDEPLDPNRPVLSTIVISQKDRDRIEEVMDALIAQKLEQPSELILVNSGRDGTAELVREKYPQVRVIHLAEPALPGKARNAGLAVARGDFVTFPGSHIVVPPGSLQKRIDAHELGYALATGAVLNGTKTQSGWASYFLDHAVALTGRPSRVLRLPPSRCSYMRGPLMAIGGFPEDRRVGEDTVVNARLYELGYRAWYSSEIRCIHKTPCTSIVRLLQHHYERGLGFGRILWEQAGRPESLHARAGTIGWLIAKYPFRRLRFISEAVRDWGASVRRPFFLSFPLIVAGVASAAAGAIRFLVSPNGTSTS